MLTDQELGELVAKVQADDVRPKDLRSFLLAAELESLGRQTDYYDEH